MECTNGDDQSGGHKLNNTSWNNNKNKNKNKNMKKKLKMGINSWEYPNENSCSWLSRNYKCSFCKREFKSAQALGGHMNIHRRERAKLRSNPPSPSWINNSTNHVIIPPSNPNPNPNTLPPSNPKNPNILTLSSSSSSPPGIYAHQYSLVSLSLSFHHSSASNFKANLSVNDEEAEDGGVKLDLDLRLIRDTKEDDQDLDLELRLGTQVRSS